MATRAGGLTTLLQDLGAELAAARERLHEAEGQVWAAAAAVEAEAAGLAADEHEDPVEIEERPPVPTALPCIAATASRCRLPNSLDDQGEKKKKESALGVAFMSHDESSNVGWDPGAVPTAAPGGHGEVWMIWRDEPYKEDAPLQQRRPSDASFVSSTAGSWQISIKIPEVVKQHFVQSTVSKMIEENRSRWTLSPDSWCCFAWDSIGGVLISYDVLMIPLQVFRMSNWTWLDWALMSYWTIDMALRFLIGFEYQGVLETRFVMIARNYLRTWFLLDAPALALDWAFAFSSGGGQDLAFSLSRSWHIIRLARVARTAARIAKVVRLFRTFTDRIQSEEVLLITKAFVVLIAMVLSAHYAGCYWYFVGSRSLHEGNSSWLQRCEFHDEGSAEIAKLYVCSLHWALAQSGFASSNTFPTSLLERTYACFITLFWLVALPTFTSHLVIWLLQLQESRRDQVMQALQIRQYMTAHGVSTRLTNRILRYFRLNYTPSARRLQEADIAFFRNLTSELRTRMHREVYLPALIWHPVFQRYADMTQLGMTAICHLATEGRHCECEQELFVKGSEAQEMIFVVSGNLYYYHGESVTPTRLEEGSWIGEAVLWQYWMHCGYLVAGNAAEIVALSASKLHAIIVDGDKLGWPLQPLRQYAQSAVCHFSKARMPSDIWGTKAVVPLAQQAFAQWEGESLRRHWFSMSRFHGRARRGAPGVGAHSDLSQGGSSASGSGSGTS